MSDPLISNFQITTLPIKCVICNINFIDHTHLLRLLPYLVLTYISASVHCVCKCIYIYIYIYIHTHTQSEKVKLGIF